MILITDGGSTKCDWVLLNARGEVLLQTQTLGLNPAVTSENTLKARIKDNAQLQEYVNTVEQVDFYGAGCGTNSPKIVLKNVLQSVFKNAIITVNEDTTAAVYAVTTQPGIVCILGTGSNSCYYNGHTILNNVASLGYVLMDEASGNYFGKQLLRDYFYKKMPSVLLNEFNEQFNVTPDAIKENLYKKENPNMYLASFASFIFKPSASRPVASSSIDHYFNTLLEKGFDHFIENRILTFKESAHVPVHFIGSIAHYSAAILKQRLEAHNLKMGTIIKRPIEGLIAYYRKHKIA